MREVEWPLGKRHQSLPKWAQEEIRRLRISEINADFESCIQADVRAMGKRVLGNNFAFADDDLRLITMLAEAAVDAELHLAIGNDNVIQDINKARDRRHTALSDGT